MSNEKEIKTVYKYLTFNELFRGASRRFSVYSNGHRGEEIGSISFSMRTGSICFFANEDVGLCGAYLEEIIHFLADVNEGRTVPE